MPEYFLGLVFNEYVMKVPFSISSVPNSSGAVDGVELRRAWQQLTQEAAEASRYLGEDLEGVLAERVEGIGQEAQGRIRQKITEQVGARRGRLLLKALELHADREARPVYSWAERDKHSALWLLAIPGPSFAFSNAEFSEAFAAMLACPCPACAGRLGQPVPGGKRVCSHCASGETQL